MATKQASVEAGKIKNLLYRFEFPPIGVSWYVMKSGKIWAASKAAAKRALVANGVLEPFEARVAEIVLAER